MHTSGDVARALLCDFGLSNFINEIEGKPYETAKVEDTPVKYKAPELVVSEGAKASKESDVYAIGCVVLEVRICLSVSSRNYG